MDAYNIIIDDNMIDSILETNVAESLGLISFKLFSYLVLFGIIPSIFVYQVNIVYMHPKKEIMSRIKLLGLSFIIINLIDFYVWKFLCFIFTGT